MAKNLGSLSVDALLKLKDDVAAALSQKADALRKQLASLGGDSSRGPKARGRSLKGRTVAPKYRDPKTGATWSGRGAPARWIADYEKQGRKRDQFLIAKPVKKKAKRKAG